MKIKLSPLLITKFLDVEEIKKLFHNFTTLTRIDVSLIDILGNEILSERVNPEYSICNIVKDMEYSGFCNKHLKYAVFKAAELGEPYTFKCGEMIRSIAPVFNDSELIGGIALGPVLLWDSDDFVPLEFSKLKIECGFDDETLSLIIKHTTKLSAEHMNSAADLLAFIVSYICQEESEIFKQRTKIMMQQRRISELIQENKEVKDIKKGKVSQEDLEKEFISLVLIGEKEEAMNLLDEILGMTLSRSKANLNIIKSKNIELLTELSKRAADMGSQSLELASILVEYTTKIVTEKNFDKMFLWVQEAVEKITNAIYHARGYQKSNENIIKAINYIKLHYGNEFTLSDVAEHVYVNPHYLSRLFRKELGMTFKNYLTKTRIDNAIQFMQEGEKEVQSLAQKVGFNDSSYFIKVFKDHVGITPYNYIKVLEDQVN